MSKKVHFKLQLPKSGADKILNTAFGRGMAEVVAEKQARIDRLEALIMYAYGKIVCNKEVYVAFDDDSASYIIEAICSQYQILKTKLNNNEQQQESNR